jgi:hypothetical protein
LPDEKNALPLHRQKEQKPQQTLKIPGDKDNNIINKVGAF